MNYRFVIGLMIMLLCSRQVISQEEENSFKKNDFYKVLSGENENDVNRQLELMKNSAIEGKDAYEGALLMKKAGLVNGAKKKLSLFKTGRNILEAKIKKDSSNVEFRFLRLIIQEHSPGFLGYKADLDKDLNYIKANFKKLALVVQQAVDDYSKTSKVLRIENH